MKQNDFQHIVNRKIRVALVGCGRISRNHFASIKAHEKNMELIAVCDTKRETLEAAAKEHGVQGYSDLKELLSKVNIDLVILCTPSGCHAGQTVLAAQHGVHVVSEKPMATNYEDGLKMVEACDAAGVRLFIVKQNRKNATLQLLKRALEDGRFGAIKMVQLNVFWTRPQEYYDQGDGWRGTWEFDGGAFMNQASHYVDLLEWLIGPVEYVQALTSTTRKIEAEDTGVVNVKWRNGALGSMAVTMLTYPKNLEGSITVMGETGTVKIGGVAVNEIQTWEFSEKYDYDDDLNHVSYETTSVYGSGHPLYYENVVDVLFGRSKPDTDGREGLKSLEVISAIYRSAIRLETIGLPLRYST